MRLLRVIMLVLLVILAILLAASFTGLAKFTGGRESRRPTIIEAGKRFPSWIVAESRAIPESVDYGLLRANREGFYSTLLPWMAKPVADVVRPLVTDGGQILDVTANIGGDTVNFAHNFPATRVTAVEVNPANLAILRRNVAALGFQDRVETVHANGITFIEKHAVGSPPYDFVYCDPPWGGPDQWRGETSMLYLLQKPGQKSMPIYEFVAKVFNLGVSRAVVLKTPPNFDEKTFRRELAEHAGGLFSEKTRLDYERAPIMKRGGREISYYLYTVRFATDSVSK